MFNDIFLHFVNAISFFVKEDSLQVQWRKVNFEQHLNPDLDNHSWSSKKICTSLKNEHKNIWLHNFAVILYQ